jgi:hypothetical protein
MDVVGLFQENRLQIIIAALVGLLLLGVAFIFVSNGSAGRSRSHPTFLLVGPSYSGKTSLFSRVSEFKYFQTVGFLCVELIGIFLWLVDYWHDSCYSNVTNAEQIREATNTI